MTLARIMAGLALALGLVQAAAAFADDLMQMRTTAVDPDMLKSMYGPWVITDTTGGKPCTVVLTDEPTIGGSVIEVDPGCEKTFPVMADIASWRLMEGWGINLADAERKTRIRFTTPENEYIAQPETDGSFTILQPQQ